MRGRAGITETVPAQQVQAAGVAGAGLEGHDFPPLAHTPNGMVFPGGAGELAPAALCVRIPCTTDGLGAGWNLFPDASSSACQRKTRWKGCRGFRLSVYQNAHDNFYYDHLRILVTVGGDGHRHDDAISIS